MKSVVVDASHGITSTQIHKKPFFSLLCLHLPCVFHLGNARQRRQRDTKMLMDDARIQCANSENTAPLTQLFSISCNIFMYYCTNTRCRCCYTSSCWWLVGLELLAIFVFVQLCFRSVPFFFFFFSFHCNVYMDDVRSSVATDDFHRVFF